MLTVTLGSVLRGPDVAYLLSYLFGSVLSILPAPLRPPLDILHPFIVSDEIIQW